MRAVSEAELLYSAIEPNAEKYASSLLELYYFMAQQLYLGDEMKFAFTFIYGTYFFR